MYSNADGGGEMDAATEEANAGDKAAGVCVCVRVCVFVFVISGNDITCSQ
jgi:hypothetical protein